MAPIGAGEGAEHTPAPGRPDAARHAPESLLQCDAGATEDASQRGVWVPLLIGGTVTAIGVTVGVVYTASAQSTMDKAHDLDRELGNNSSCVSGQEADPDRCDHLRSLAEKVDTQRNLSYVGFGAAGAAVAATLTYLFWPTEQKPSGQVRPGFTVGAQHTIVSLSGRF